MTSALSSERPVTIVADMHDRARFLSRAHIRAVSLVGAVLSAALLAGCSASWSSDQGKTIAPKGSAYSYKVPHGWLVDGGDSFEVNGRSFQTAVHGQTGLAVIAVSQQSIGKKITPSNLNAIESEYKRQAARWQYPPTNWRKTSLAGAPALRYHRSGTNAGETREIDAYVAFKARSAFYVECIYTRETRRDVKNACSKVVGSLVLN